MLYFLEHKENQQVEYDAGDDERELERKETPGAVLLPEAAEHNGLKSIHSCDGCKAGYVFGMVGIAHQIRNGMQQAENQREKGQSDAPYHKERSRIDLLFVLALLGSKTEQRGLHAESQKGKEQGGISVEVGHDSVSSASRRYLIGIDRYQQIVQEPANDAAEPIKSRIFQKR